MKAFDRNLISFFSDSRVSPDSGSFEVASSSEGHVIGNGSYLTFVFNEADRRLRARAQLIKLTAEAIRSEEVPRH